MGADFHGQYYGLRDSCDVANIQSTRPSTVELEEDHQCAVCKLKLDEEKWKHASLVEQNGFGPAFLPQFAEAGKKHSKP